MVFLLQGVADWVCVWGGGVVAGGEVKRGGGKEGNRDDGMLGYCLTKDQT